MVPNSPECAFIHPSMAGSRSTAPLNRSNSVLIVAPLFSQDLGLRNVLLEKASGLSCLDKSQGQISGKPTLPRLGNVFANRNRLDSNTARQTDRDYLAVIFPRQFQSPMVVVAVRVFPIKGHRSSRNLYVVNGQTLGKSRVGHNVDRACGFGIHAVTAYLYAADKFAFLGAQLQNNNWSSCVNRRP